MPAPGEHKTVQARILACAQEIESGLPKHLGVKAEDEAWATTLAPIQR